MSKKNNFNQLARKYGIEFPDNIVTSTFKAPGKLLWVLPTPVHVYHQAVKQTSGLYNIYQKTRADIASDYNHVIKEEQLDLETAIKKLHEFETGASKYQAWHLQIDRSEKSKISAPYYKFVAEVMGIVLEQEKPDSSKAFSVPFKKKPSK